MSYFRVLATTVCAVGLSLPQILPAQSMNTPRDSMRVRDSLTTIRRERRDSVRAARTGLGVMQAPATSQERLRVQKEVKGESRGTLVVSPATLREDSIAADAQRRDAIERARRDSVQRSEQFTRDSTATAERVRTEAAAREETLRLEAIAAARRDSTMRADSIAQAAQLYRDQQGQYRFRGSGFYMGVAAGAVKPTGNFQNLGYNSGLNVNVPIGYHVQNQLLGLRVDLGYATFRGKDFTGDLVDGSRLVLSNNNPKVLSATANLTAHLPLTASKNLNLYGVTGAGIYQFRTFGSKTALGGFFGNDVQSTSAEFQSVRNKLGAQFGAGLEYAVGPAAIYVESRIVNIFANRKNDVAFNDFFGANAGQNLRWMPLMIGMNFR
jgi:opacity protein-like surface antigen